MNLKDCESRLQALKEEYEEFAYIVSHDLKAPVRAVANLATWLEEDLAGNMTGESQANFLLLKKRAARLNNMIEALLEFSRATRSQLEISHIDLTQKIPELASNLNNDLQTNAVIKINGQVPALHTYALKLTFVLQALLQNAIVFNDKTQPEVNIYLEEQADFIRIMVEDNGPGVPDKNLLKIFAMFYTCHAKDSLDTTGAGLTIVQKILNFVGGTIQVENIPGGFRVSFTWPKAIH